MSVDTVFKFQRDQLLPMADELRSQFLSASPFPHVVIDDFLPPDVLHQVLAEFPEPEGVTGSSSTTLARSSLHCLMPSRWAQ